MVPSHSFPFSTSSSDPPPFPPLSLILYIYTCMYACLCVCSPSSSSLPVDETCVICCCFSRYLPGYFPSEATFVPAPATNTRAEDDGVLVFSALHGADHQAYREIACPASWTWSDYRKDFVLTLTYRVRAKTELCIQICFSSGLDVFEQVWKFHVEFSV